MSLRSMINIPAILLLALVAVTGAGCQFMPTAETPAQRLAIVDAQFTAAVETATEMRQAGELSAEDENRLNELIIRGDQALSLAWEAMLAGRGADADRYAEVAGALLTQLRNSLQEREAQS